jgi:hypothetical protein
LGFLPSFPPPQPKKKYLKITLQQLASAYLSYLNSLKYIFPFAFDYFFLLKKNHKNNLGVALLGGGGYGSQWGVALAGKRQRCCRNILGSMKKNIYLYLSFQLSNIYDIR